MTETFDAATDLTGDEWAAAVDLLADADIDAGYTQAVVPLAVDVHGVTGLAASVVEWAYHRWVIGHSGLRGSSDADLGYRSTTDPEEPRVAAGQIGATALVDSTGLVRRFVVEVASNEVDELWVSAATVLIARLVRGRDENRDSTVAVGDVAEVMAEHSAAAESAEVFERDHWPDFTEALEDLEPVTIARGSGGGTRRHRLRVPQAPDTGPTVRTAAVASVVRALAGAAALSDDTGDGLLVDIEEPARTARWASIPGRIRRRFPVLVPSALIDLAAEDASMGEFLGGIGAVVDIDSETASDYGALKFSNPLAEGMFDDLPEADVLVATRFGDAMPTSDDFDADTIEFGRYAVVVTVWIGRSEVDGARDIVVDVAARDDTALSPGELGSAAADSLSAWGVRSPLDVVEVGEALTADPEPEALVTIDAQARDRIASLFGEVRDVLPVSALQEGLLFHLQSAETAASTDLYASQFQLHLGGSVDTERMREAIRALLRRHPNLTAGFASFGDRALSVIPDSVAVPFRRLPREDWTQEFASVADLVEHERGQPFSATSPPLIRFLLIDQSDDSSLLCVTFEHILADGWSAGLMMDSLLDLYTDPSGRSLPPAVPFRSYLQWLGGRDLDTARRVWANQMSGVDEPTLLRPDAAGLSATTSMARDHHEDLDAALSEQIRLAARAAGVTISTFLQAAWGITLSRLVGKDDVVFGTTVSGRPADLEGSESIVGLLFNTVPVRMTIRPGQSVADALTHLHGRNMDVLEHPYLGLGDIQASAGLRTLFDTLFIIQNHPGRRDGQSYGPEGELSVTDAALTDSTHYPVSFAVYPGEQIHVRCAYRGDVLDASEVAILVSRLRGVLEAMATDVEQSVGGIAVATADEVDVVFGQWNATDRAVEPVLVSDLFDRRVALSPDEIALTAGDERLTFGELSSRVHRLARAFAARGVGPESRVILMLPRDERMITAMFATFAIGAAYVPVDADYPADRIGFMIEAARPTLIVTTTELSRGLGKIECALLDLADPAVPRELESHRTEMLSDDEKGGPTHLDNLAYIIFTSGSTGRPKGVAVPYRGLTNMYFNHAERIFDRVVARQGGRRMRIAHTTSFSFDASWEQLFWLLAGHEVHVIDEDMRRDPAALLAYYDREVIDGFDVTPSYALYLIERGLLDRDRPRGLSVSESSAGVVFVSLGGEAVPDVLWTALRDAPGVEGYNLYGPTEYTINALGADVADSAVSSVGNPIFNTRAHILDSGLNPAVPGVAGELYLAGAGIARGYAEQPAMTGHRFVACPWGTGERMYRTGDLARWRVDGSIEYLGRADDQVKIRGFRIELGEIVNVLLDSDLVAQATVVVNDTAAGPSLLAYVVPAGADIDLEELRAHVADRLPEYMIPSGYGVIDAIPLTVNGKVDTRALPEVESGEQHHVAPRTDAEESVAQIVAEILDIDRVSVDDDFFRLGGHSLLAMRVVARVNGELGADLSLRDVFDSPTVAGIAAVVGGGAADGPGRARVSDVVCGDVIPASYGQQALWLIGQVTGAGAVYTIPVLLSAGTDFDPAVWSQALADVVVRQEALRTRLVDAGDGMLAQQIVPADEVGAWLDVERVDVAGLPRSDVSERVQSWVQVPVDVAVDFPVRAALFTGAAQGVVIALAIHHAFMDEWSLPVLLRDLGVAYSARRRDQAPGWDAPAVSYGQYAVWQREVLGDGDVPGSLASRQLDYWSSHLSGAPDVSMVATDRPRPAEASFDGFTLDFDVEDAVTRQLRELCGASDISMYMVVQAAVAVTMSAFGAGDDVVLGSPVGGRGDVDLDDLVGYFVNTLPLRHRLNGNPSLVEVLDRTREVVLGGFANQDVPFDQIVKNSGAARSSAHNPVFQTLVTYRAAGVIGSSAGSLASAGFAPYTDRVSIGAVKSDLEIDVADGADSLTGVLSCAASLFDESTAQRLIAGLQRVFAAFAGDTDLRLSDVTVLGATDLERINTWSRGQLTPATPATLDVLFANAVRAHPDQVAVRGGGKALSYREFDAAVQRVWRLLLDRGTVPESRVAILMPRSTDMVVGVVGVITAGATVVPIDPSYPRERIRQVLSDCRPALVLTTTSLAEDIAPITSDLDTEVVCLDTDNDVTEEIPARRATSRTAISPSSAAYVIYTSGSTGRPKGVVVSHEAIINLIRWRQSVFTLDVGDGVLQKTSVGFDPAIPEILWPLIHGAVVVLADDGGDRDLEYLGRALNSGDIAFVELVPSVIAAMIEQGVDVSDSGLKYLSAGGEALSAQLHRQIEKSWGVPVWNTYGPAEAAVEVTSFDAGLTAERDGRSAVPIGSPVWNTHVVVLDDLLRPVPPGVTGELYVGGAQLARGYLDRPDLTAGRFIADPAGRTGHRMYRTGDLVRWTDTGDLVFIGRADSQVKVNGSRVELGDVEAALHTAPGVANCAVTIASTNGISRLLAYVTPADGRTVEDLDPAAIRAALFDRVPAHMVPATVIALDALPRTANGKLDHAALPDPDVAGPGGGRGPSTDTERAIASIFAEVLGVVDQLEAEQLPADDDFFRMGGHSLLAMRVVARVNGDLGAALSLRDVFDRPSIAGLAAAVDGAVADGGAARVRVSDMVTGDVIPASFGQQALWLIGQVTGAGSVYTIPIVLSCGTDFDWAAWSAALTDVVLRQETLRTLLVDTGDGVLVQRVVPADEVEAALRIEELDVSGIPAEGVLERVESWVQRPVDVGADFPLRAATFAHDGNMFVALAIHHVSVDEWSLPVLLRDVGVAYSARRGGQAPDWEPLPVSYGQYALWQRELLGDGADAGSTAARQLNYWSSHLAGAPEVSMVATDGPRPAVASFDGSSVDFVVDEAVAQQLRKLCATTDVSMYMLFQAAVAVTMSAYGAGDDIVLGSPVGGRGDVDLDGVVGYFVNTLPLRHRLDGNPTLAQVLDEAREVVLGGFANQDVPFDQIVKISDVTRSNAHNPLFQTLVTYRVASVMDSTVDVLAEAGFAPFGERVGIGSVKSDLEVDIGESADGLVGLLSYATSLFTESTARRLADGLVRVLTAFAGDVDQRLSDVDVVAAGELERLSAWSHGAAVPADEPLVDVLVARTARAHPDAVAVRGGGTSLSYREFDSAVNRLARLLLAGGTRTGDRVAVLLNRSVELPSVLAAVLRSGAAFVPIDPSYPADRIDYVLNRSLTETVIVDASTRDRLSEVALPQHTVILDLDDDELSGRLDATSAAAVVDADRSRPIHERDAAYVIYTSGSTGRPKGVVIEHRGLVNFLHWKRTVTGIERDDRVLQKTPISFDASVWEFFVPLMIGATVVMADPDGHRDPAYLAEIIAAEQLTTIEFVPSMLDALLEFGIDSVDMSSLRRIFCGGEALSAATAHAAVARFGDILFNLYGPTETTVGITSQEVSSSLLQSDARFGGLPIGVPAHNSEAWVLDHRLRPAPIGVVGELYLGGPQLARGYFGRPDLTAGAFVAHPSSPDPGERLYRTGDLVRWNVSGALEYLGRVDDQIKIRGFRVEVDEIRTVLEKHPGIRSAAVVARDRPGGGAAGRYLAAYYCSEGDLDSDAVAGLELSVREHLAARLPEYMVPTAYRLLDALPVTVNGKLDAKALPEPETASGGGTPPATEIQRRVAREISDVLGISDENPLTLEDNFFRLGGHSLLAARLVGRINGATGGALTMQMVFAHPTVGGLAAASESAGGRAPDSDPIVLRLEAEPEPGTGSVFCVHASSGFGTVYSTVAPFVAGRGLVALQDPAHAGDPRDFTSIDEVVDAYTRSVLSEQPDGPYDLLGWSYGGHIAFGIARQLRALGKEVASLTILDTPPVTEATIHLWEDAEREDEVRSSFARFAELTGVERLSRSAIAARNAASTGPLSHLGEAEALAFMDSFDRCLRLMEATPTHGVVDIRALLVLGREHKDSIAETTDLWRQHCSGGVEVHYADIDHEEMISAAGVPAWATVWARYLDADEPVVRPAPDH